jgi:hypothetical protein
MKATLGNENSNAIKYDKEKELIRSWNVIVNSNDGLKNIITARCYMGRSASASTMYASIWIYDEKHHTSGSGKAGGYGYHKQSAAISDAIESAGIELNEDISGRGDSAIKEALEAIAATLGFESCLIVQN